MSRQTMSALLRTLVYRGWLSAPQAPSGRVLPPRLTTKGRSLLKEAWRATVEFEWVVMSRRSVSANCAQCKRHPWPVSPLLSGSTRVAGWLFPSCWEDEVVA